MKTYRPKQHQPQPLAPGAYLLHYKHDDHCPTLHTQRLDDCRCRPDVKLVSYSELQRRGQKRGAK